MLWILICYLRPARRTEGAANERPAPAERPGERICGEARSDGAAKGRLAGLGDEEMLGDERTDGAAERYMGADRYAGVEWNVDGDAERRAGDELTCGDDSKDRVETLGDARTADDERDPEKGAGSRDARPGDIVRLSLR